MCPRILVVDDSESWTSILVALFEQEGYEATGTTDPDEAMRRVRRNPPDLLVSDVFLPGADGMPLATMLKTEPVSRPVPVVMLGLLPETPLRSWDILEEVREALAGK